MEKRVLLTIGISIAIIVVWQVLFPPPKPPAQPAAPPPAATAPAAPGVAPTAAGTPAAPAGERAKEDRVTVERPGLWRAVFSTWGAAPAEFTLLDPQYKEYVWLPKPGVVNPPPRAGDEDPNYTRQLVPINLVKTGAGALPFGVTFPESSFALAPDTAWTLVSKSDDELVYGVDVGQVHVEKRWQLPRAGYQLGLRVTVKNGGDKPVTEHLQIQLPGWHDPTVKASGMSFGKRMNVLEAACHTNNKYRHESLESLLKEKRVEVGDVKWAALNEQFFLVAAAFAPEPGQERRCSLGADATGRLWSEAYFAARTVAAGQTTEYPMVAYLGPKRLDLLDDVKVGGADVKLGDAVNYTLEFVARPMLWVLKQIQRVVVNWGVAIIIITILLKLVTYYPTMRSMKSMRAMAALKPKMDAIRDKWKDDKNRQNQETMALYKQHGINPLGGCLPTLIQMPIYIAFYSMLSNAVELYRARFVGPIDDMTAAFWPLAAVTGALMFLQQRFAPQTGDSQQQKMMMYMMPIMFTAFTIFLPSGLTLYILTNTILTMVQQWWFNRTHPLPIQPATKAAKA